MSHRPQSERSHHRRDIVALGASAGGITTLQRLVSLLPEEFPAVILVVQHIGRESMSRLPEILDRAGPLEARHPENDGSLTPGRILVAPPDRQMLIDEGRLRIADGPRVNHNRPAIDPLFLTSAAAFDSRVIGAVLSGALDDGVAGLCGIGAAGGHTLVQDPDEAPVPDMPRHALRNCEVDDCSPVEGMAERLVTLAGREVEPVEPPTSVRQEARMFLDPLKSIDEFEEITEPTTLVCPECGGPLRYVREAALPAYFRCHTGHVLSPETLLDQQREGVEQAIWTALRTLQERVRLLRTLAEDGNGPIAEHHRQRAREIDEQVASLEMLLVDEE